LPYEYVIEREDRKRRGRSCKQLLDNPIDNEKIMEIERESFGRLCQEKSLWKRLQTCR
jgi:hypothetical protein